MDNTKKFPRGRLGWLWENMQGSRGIYIVGMFGTVVYNIMQLTVPYFSGQIVDTFITGEGAAERLAQDRDLFYKMLLMMVGFTLIRTIIVYGDCMIFEHVSQKALYRIRNYLYDKIQRQDMNFYSTYRTGDLMTRVTGDLDAVRHMIAWVVRMVIESFSLFGATAIYFIYLNWKMAFSLLAVAPFVFLVIFLFKRKVAPMHAALRERLADMNTIAQENIAGNRVVKAFAREDYEIEKFDKANVAYRDTNKKTGLVWIKFYPYIESFANLMPFVMLLVGGLFLINGSLSMGEYVTFSGLIWALANPMRLMGNIMNEFQRFAAASNKVMEIYYSEAEIKDPENPYEPKDRLEGSIEFKNVSFMYKDGKLPVLKNISFKINPGETVALMGETGCGKTSLIHLIPRFYEATEGQVLVDDVPVENYRLSSLRKNIGLATQDVLLYSDSIEGNIAYGDNHIKKEEVVRFARYSAADEFIARMPEGYDTIVGERGVGLSGGQKQRISLARALAVKPSILILDDTTSAVDMETEKKIQDALMHLDFKATKLIIAQRISTTKNADRILILKDGSIVEQGSHEELIKAGGYYSDLVKLQQGDD
ncbi:MAG: ABC transporter ATP-binding protein/permease [Eubacterium sp.]|nr:ABC transporter ATP-binding protein/permease [Eubacterium sp.]